MIDLNETQQNEDILNRMTPQQAYRYGFGNGYDTRCFLNSSEGLDISFRIKEKDYGCVINFPFNELTQPFGGSQISLICDINKIKNIIKGLNMAINEETGVIKYD